METSYYATIKGIEVMRAPSKGLTENFYFGHLLDEVRLASKFFEI